MKSNRDCSLRATSVVDELTKTPLDKQSTDTTYILSRVYLGWELLKLQWRDKTSILCRYSSGKKLCTNTVLRYLIDLSVICIFLTFYFYRLYLKTRYVHFTPFSARKTNKQKKTTFFNHCWWHNVKKSISVDILIEDVWGLKRLET